jgi:glycolate oxidase
MNAPTPAAALAEPARPDAALQAAQQASQRAARQQQVVAALRGVLPAHALLHHREDTVPYECDGLTAYRALPLAVALPETEAQVAAVLKACHASACRWWRAAPAPA